MRFSQRIGKAPVKTELEKEGMSDELRNTLWTTIHEYIIVPLGSGRIVIRHETITLDNFYKFIWTRFLKQPIDSTPRVSSGIIGHDAKSVFRRWYFEADWYKVYDLLEFLVKYDIIGSQFINGPLESEYSAYRFVDNVLAQINSEQEVFELENAIDNLDSTSPARQHLRQALVLLSNRKNPDYRNSIKESISAVESLVKTLLKDDKATLGNALKIIKENHGLHPALRTSFTKLYGYTSDSGGIRHAMKEGDPKVNEAEARFMLVTCSAFVNYLITKLN